MFRSFDGISPLDTLQSRQSRSIATLQSFTFVEFWRSSPFLVRAVKTKSPHANASEGDIARKIPQDVSGPRIPFTLSPSSLA